MDNTFGFNSQKDIDDLSIEVERTAAFYAAAEKLGDYIKCLPLNRPTNDRLIELIIRQVKEAEQGSFNQGFRMGKAFSEYNAHP